MERGRHSPTVTSAQALPTLGPAGVAQGVSAGPGGGQGQLRSVVPEGVCLGGKSRGSQADLGSCPLANLSPWL